MPPPGSKTSSRRCEPAPISAVARAQFGPRPRPASRASTAACTRSATCSLFSTLDTRLLTVFVAMPSLVATTAVGRPAAIRSSTGQFPVGEVRERPRRRRRCGELLQHPAGDAGAEHGLAGVHGAEGPCDVVLLGPLEQIALSTGLHGREQRIVVIEHRQHAQRGRRSQPADLAQRAEPVQLRHLQVEQGDIRTVQHDLLDRGTAVGDHGDDLHVGQGADQRGQSGPHDRVVVGHQYADHERAPIRTRPRAVGPARPHRMRTGRCRRCRPTRRPVRAWP